uniref:Uncharacterized protein n=1 Tax=Oryzias latipes TaxID=8090 RepID=A0A3B3HJ65_ORYLA
VMTLILSIQRSLNHQLWINFMCNGQRKAGSSIVIYVLYINLDHADFLVVGKHLHGELALWVAPSTLGVNIHKMRCRILQHSEVGFLPPFNKRALTHKRKKMGTERRIPSTQQRQTEKEGREKNPR